MATKNDQLLKRLLATFRVEADDHAKAITAGLLTLESTPAGPEADSIVETIFREAHSLKGAARSVNLSVIESLCQAMEGVFAVIKGGGLPVSMAILDLMHRAIGQLEGLLAGDLAGSVPVTSALTAMIADLDRAAAGAPPQAPNSPRATAMVTAPAPETVPLAAPTTATVRLAVDKLDRLMRQVEELLSPRLAAAQRLLELRAAMAAVAERGKARAKLQPALRRVEREVARSGGGQAQKEWRKVLEYLDGEPLFLANLGDRLTRLGRAAGRDQRVLAAATEGLARDVRELQLLPFSSLLELLRRLARDLARDQGKEVELLAMGADIEIDRRILDELKDPLIHLLRNAVDHGIEKPAERTAAGKSARGSITIEVVQRDSGKVELHFADDGSGIDAGRVGAAATRLGVQAPDKGEDGDAAIALVFRSGVSTSPIITDVSGRGLGLAIVREKVERLGGRVTVESQPGRGTAFQLVLPLSLATLHGVLVRAGEQVYVIPAAGVERVARVPAGAVRTVENRETIVLDGRVVALADLADVLEIRRAASPDARATISVVVVGIGENRIAFRVDEVVGEQEILIKPLGPQLARVRNVAGASVLGTGQMVAVLNVVDLMKSAAGRASAPAALAALAIPEASAHPARRAVLVAEDSITSRSLLKGILESAGYAVTTAVDGMDAYTALKTGDFELLVSDVEMPRMDGFALTAKVRGDKRLADLPVVLVTALETREHRERGIDVGANAYIVKSSFDQSNLLETVRRLI